MPLELNSMSFSALISSVVFSRVTFLPPLTDYGMTQGDVFSPINFLKKRLTVGEEMGRFFPSPCYFASVKAAPEFLTCGSVSPELYAQCGYAIASNCGDT